METLETKWKQLKLSIEEDNEIQLDENAIQAKIHKGKNSIISKLHMDQKISKEIVHTTMSKAWKPTNPLSILEISSNVYIFSFESKEDMQEVMDRQPWLFKTLFLLLKPFDGYMPAAKIDFSKEFFWVHMHKLPIDCMNERTRTDIGKSIGVVKLCNVQRDGSWWGMVLRVLIELDLHKPILRGRTINVQGSLYWIPLTYKELPMMWRRQAI